MYDFRIMLDAFVSMLTGIVIIAIIVGIPYLIIKAIF